MIGVGVQCVIGLLGVALVVWAAATGDRPVHRHRPAHRRRGR